MDDPKKRSSANEELKAALEQIETVLNPSMADLIGQTKDLMAQACLIIGHAMQIKFVLPRDLAKISDPETKLEAICRESQIQKRKVRLEGDWWKEDHGPLLGFWGKEEHPAALLNRIQYQLVNKTNVKTITKPLAKEISSTAYMFYVPFNPKIKTGRQIFNLIVANHMRRWKAAIFTIFSAMIYTLFPPIAVKIFFQYAIPGNHPHLILYLVLGLFFSAIGIAFYHYLQGLFFLNIKGNSSNLVLGAFWDRLLRLPSRFFRRYATGTLSSYIFALDEIFRLANIHSLNLLFSGVFALLYLFAMLYFAPLLALLVFLISLFGIGISAVCSYCKIGVLRKAIDAGSAIQGALLKFVVGIGKFRTARAEAHAFSYWASLFTKYQSLRLKAQNLQDIAKTANHFLPLLSIFLVYLGLLEWIPVKEISLSNFLAFNIAFGSFCLTIYPLGDALLQLVDIIPLWERAKIFLEEHPEEEEHKPTPEKLSGQIQLDNLIYSFDPKLPPILNGISLTIKPGEFIGITGSGKTALFRLLVGLEKPQSGVIFFDDRDLWSLDLCGLRRQIGTYFQELRIFSSSIMMILKYGRSGGPYSEEQVQEAIEFSNFDKELASFPMKGMTRTDTLSGSQKERLFLSKAVIGNPPIILLDEPTASLDSESRSIVNRNIANRKETRIYATIHLDNLRKADRIYVLDKGKVIQTGIFEELANEPGWFAELLEKQTKNH